MIFEIYSPSSGTTKCDWRFIFAGIKRQMKDKTRSAIYLCTLPPPPDLFIHPDYVQVTFRYISGSWKKNPASADRALYLSMPSLYLKLSCFSSTTLFISYSSEEQLSRLYPLSSVKQNCFWWRQTHEVLAAAGMGKPILFSNCIGPSLQPVAFAKAPPHSLRVPSQEHS